MKRHVGHITLGGLLVPLILGLATAAGAGIQSGLGLGLHGTALSIFLVGFVAGASLVLHGSMKVEAAKIAGELDVGKMIGDVGKALFGGGGVTETPTTRTTTPPAAPPPALTDAAETPPPPPAP